MKGRIEIVPERLNEFSVVKVIFSNFENIQIYPRTKRLIMEDGFLIENIDVAIKKCRIGRKLELEFDGSEKYKSVFDIFKIKIRK